MWALCGSPRHKQKDHNPAQDGVIGCRQTTVCLTSTHGCPKTREIFHQHWYSADQQYEQRRAKCA